MDIALLYTLNAFAFGMLMIAATALALKTLFALVNRNVDVRSARYSSSAAAAREANDDAGAQVVNLAAPAESTGTEAAIRSSPPVAAT